MYLQKIYNRRGCRKLIIVRLRRFVFFVVFIFKMDGFASHHVYFGGAGFSCAYYIGVVKALRELHPNQQPYIHADSAGTMVALGYALNVPCKVIEQVYYDSLTRQSRRSNRIWGGAISNDHNFIINTFLKVGTFELIRGNSKFTVGVCSFFNRYNTYTNWETMGDVATSIHKSMTIPFLTRTRYSFEIDGAFANQNQYDLSIGTSTGFDIFMPQSWGDKLSIPTREKVRALIHMGYTDTREYYTTHEDRKKSRPQPSGLYSYLVLACLWMLKLCSMCARALYLID